MGASSMARTAIFKTAQAGWNPAAPTSCGAVAEGFIAASSNLAVGQTTVGSNPTRSDFDYIGTHCAVKTRTENG